MSNPDPENEPLDDPRPSGPNLWLIYGVMLVAMLVAFALAAMVVWPYYTHRH